MAVTDSLVDINQVWDLILSNFIGCLVIFARMSGIFTLNPIFGRTNVPVRIRAAMTVGFTLLVISMMGGNTGYVPASIVGFVLMLIKEAFIGYVFGVVIYLIMTIIIYAGELIDNQTGLTMAKAMDPGTGVTMPIFANLFTYMFLLYFFMTGGHLAFIKMFALSYEAIPIDYAIKPSLLNLLRVLVMYLGTVMEMAVKMAMPVVATELIVEFVVGILMKAVPTIQIFVINIQLKIAVGLIILVIIASPMAEFIQHLLNLMWTNLYGAYEQF